MITCKDIVLDYLKKHGYDGVVNVRYDCYCGLYGEAMKQLKELKKKLAIMERANELAIKSINDDLVYALPLSHDYFINTAAQEIINEDPKENTNEPQSR